MQQGFLNPANVLSQIDLREDMTACDLGCGSGGWSIPLAKILGKGKVYAIDILQEPLSGLESNIRQERLFNVTPMLADAEKCVKIVGDSVDLILLTNILFQAKDPDKILAEAKRILKTGGELLVIDWKKEAALGPKEGRISKDDAISMGDRKGFALVKEIEAGMYHWGILLVKNN